MVVAGEDASLFWQPAAGPDAVRRGIIPPQFQILRHAVKDEHVSSPAFETYR